MKVSIAIAVAALFATGTAFAQNVQTTTKKAPVQVAQSQPVQVAQAGGASMGAGSATGAVGTGLSANGILAVAAGTSAVVAASGSNSTTNH